MTKIVGVPPQVIHQAALRRGDPDLRIGYLCEANHGSPLFGLDHAGALLFRGALEEAEGECSGGLELLRDAGDRVAQARLLADLGVIWQWRGDLERATGAFRECVGLAERFGDGALASISLEGLGLIATAREGIRRTMGMDIEPDISFVQRWERGIPNYSVGHLKAMDKLFSHAAHHANLHLNCNAYRGIAMNDCVRNSRELAEKMCTA